MAQVAQHSEAEPGSVVESSLIPVKQRGPLVVPIVVRVGAAKWSPIVGIKSARQALKLTQAQLAHTAGCYRVTISRAERGLRLQRSTIAAIQGAILREREKQARLAPFAPSGDGALQGQLTLDHALRSFCVLGSAISGGSK